MSKNTKYIKKELINWYEKNAISHNIINTEFMIYKSEKGYKR